MENINTGKSLFDMSFDENVKQSLKGAAKWGGIAAIGSLVSTVLGLINYFVEKGKRSQYSDNIRVNQATETSGFITMIITLAIGIVLFVFLNKFSGKTKSGIDANDQSLVGEGLGSLSSYFKFIGVLLIILIVLVGMGVLVGIGENI
jgi:hypothetical protein